MIASLIETSESVVDVGCDHGYLAVELKNRGHRGRIICTDNKKGPLENARRNLDEAGYHDVETVLTDGVSTLEGHYDVTVMAGMGYHTVAQIMTQSKEYFREGRIIIQVNTDVPMMRRFLNEHGFRITDEKVIREYKYYEIITAMAGKQQLNDEQIRFGPCLLKNRDEAFLEYCHWQIRKRQSIIERLPADHPDREIHEDEIRKISAVITEH